MCDGSAANQGHSIVSVAGLDARFESINKLLGIGI